MSVHKLVKMNVLFSDVVQNKEQIRRNQSDSRTDVKKPLSNCIWCKLAISVRAKLCTIIMAMLVLVIWLLMTRCQNNVCHTCVMSNHAK